MYKVNVNDKGDLTVHPDFKNNLVMLNDKTHSIEVNHSSPDILRLSVEGKMYEALILKFNPEDKSVLLKINQNKYTVQLKDKYDDLLKKLGFDLGAGKKQNSIKAPMPGLVLKLLVEEGAAIKKGDPLIILEAMKMENILKSPADAIVKKISISKGNTVEKNQLLIELS